MGGVRSDWHQTLFIELDGPRANGFNENFKGKLSFGLNGETCSLLNQSMMLIEQRHLHEDPQRPNSSPGNHPLAPQTKLPFQFVNGSIKQKLAKQ